MRQIENRRFMFSPQSGELIFGRQYKGSQLYASHAEEHGESGAKAPYDSFIRGWVGTGRQYPHGVIHFAPNVESANVEQFEKAFSALEIFRENGAEGQTVIRGFGDAWEQPLSNIIPDQERSDRVSEVFSIQLSNHTTQPDGKTGVWLDLPATAEQVQAAMGQIGVTQDNPWDYFISGFSSPEGRHLAIPYDLALASGVNELNFLAARLEKLDAYEIGTLNAALQQKDTELRTISRIIDYPDNLDYFVNLPDIHTVAALGDYYLNRSGMVDMPDKWKPAIDAAALGNHIAGLEQGAFTEYGYIVKSGDPWRQVYEGQIIPEEYRVLSFPPPQVELDEASRPQREQTAPTSQPVIPIVLNGRNNAERMKEITDRLEAGIQALFESEQYKNYLTAMSKFHNYSFNNTLLIAMQKPDASLVAGYNKWKDDFERQVKRGEKAIKILAPAPYKVRRQVEKLDASGRPIPGPDGKPLTEEKEITVPAFKVVSVFDVSQTEGREIPDIAVNELTGSVERYQDFFTALERTSPVPIAFENIESGAHGYYHLEEKRIAIDEGMSELQNLKTAIHEIAHATLHVIDKDATPEELAGRPDRRTREVQAESVAYTVCQHYGLDTSDYSFGYVAGWSSGKELSELKASLETIRATANDLITKIDGHLAQLQQEREARQEQAPPIWNGLDGLINDKPFMPGATPEQQANALIDFAERDGQRLGNGERRLVVDYANVIRDYHKVADLINELCEDGYELQHGGVDIAVKMRVEREIAEAPPIFLDPDAEPLVTVIWSESADLRDGEQMPLSQADAVFKALDDAMKNEPGYDKTKFRIDFTMNGKADNYEGRQDFGDGDGSLIEHIQGYHEYYAQSESWKKSVIERTGIEGWEQEVAERDMILGEFVPYLKLHCNLSAMEREAQRPLQSGEALPPEQTAYFNAVLDYVKDCRPLLNQGQYQLPEPPRLADFDVELQEYKVHVMDEIQREAAAAGMTVEEYAANGYEPAIQPEAAQANDTPEQTEPAALPTVEPTPEGISAELYDLMCAYDPEFMKDYANREDQIGGTIREMQAVGPTSFELVIVGIRDDEQAPAALRERAAALMDTIDRYKELNNTFSIYQVRGGPETRDFRFEPYYRLLATGRTVDPANYDLVYTAPLRDTDTLESIYRQFNTDHPADFTGRSLSVSDVVVLRHGDRQEAHYCDDVGFQEVPEFFAQQEQRLTPNTLLTGERVQTPRGSFRITDMTREQMEAAGYGFHHQSEDGKYFIMGNGTNAYAIAVQRENPLRTTELSTEQNENMIDGVLNNAPSPGEVTAKEEAGEPVAEQPPQTDAPEQTAVHYYTINEGAARRAKEANSFYDYKPGSATAEYRSMVDKAVEIAQRQKKRVDPEFHDKIDQLLDTYARLLAQNMNKGYEIAARVPSVMIAGPANFPVKKKQKQNAADDKNMREWQDIQGLLDKIRSTGMGGISADDPNAIDKLQAKLEKLEATQEMMKAVNAYYRKHKTLEGCPHLSQKSIEAFQSGMAEGGGGSPFLPWQLSNNNANIRQVRSRIEQLTRQRENVFVGWEFDGGTVEINREANRLQIFFEGKPDEATRNILKENSFRWSPKAGAWQRQLNDNTFWVVDRIAFLRPLSGEKPSELQTKARKEQEKPSIRAQLKAAKDGQQPKAPTKDKSQDLEV